MFQKDYWALNDQELAEEAKSHNIPIEHCENIPDTSISYQVFNRDYVIASLVGRDAALRTRWITAMSITSILISLAALAVSVFRK